MSVSEGKRWGYTGGINNTYNILFLEENWKQARWRTWWWYKGVLCAFLYVFTSSYFLIKWKIRRGREEGRKKSRQEWKKGQECKLAWLHIWSERCLSFLNKINPRKRALKLGHKMRSENHVLAPTMNCGLLLILDKGRQILPTSISEEFQQTIYTLEFLLLFFLNKNIPLAMNSHGKPQTTGSKWFSHMKKEGKKSEDKTFSEGLHDLC